MKLIVEFEIEVSDSTSVGDVEKLTNRMKDAALDGDYSVLSCSPGDVSFECANAAEQS